MRYGIAAVLVCLLGCTTSQRMEPAVTAVEAAEEVRQAENEWNAAIDRRDVAAMERFLAPEYALVVGVHRRPLQVIPREVWLRNLSLYDIRSYSIDDMRVNVYGNVAVVTMLFTQEAVVGPEQRDRSAQFFITDIWVKRPDGWRVSERHSSRPEQPPRAAGVR